MQPLQDSTNTTNLMRIAGAMLSNNGQASGMQPLPQQQANKSFGFQPSQQANVSLSFPPQQFHGCNFCYNQGCYMCRRRCDKETQTQNSVALWGFDPDEWKDTGSSAHTLLLAEIKKQIKAFSIQPGKKDKVSVNMAVDQVFKELSFLQTRGTKQNKKIVRQKLLSNVAVKGCRARKRQLESQPPREERGEEPPTEDIFDWADSPASDISQQTEPNGATYSYQGQAPPSKRLLASPDTDFILASQTPVQTKNGAQSNMDAGKEQKLGEGSADTLLNRPENYAEVHSTADSIVIHKKQKDNVPDETNDDDPSQTKDDAGQHTTLLKRPSLHIDESTPLKTSTPEKVSALSSSVTVTQTFKMYKTSRDIKFTTGDRVVIGFGPKKFHYAEIQSVEEGTKVHILYLARSSVTGQLSRMGGKKGMKDQCHINTILALVPDGQVTVEQHDDYCSLCRQVYEPEDM